MATSSSAASGADVDLVVDASVLVELAVRGPRAEALAREIRPHDLLAPELLDAEVAHALKSLERGGRMTGARAAEALAMLVRAPVRRVSHVPLLTDAWRLRHALSSYDALYVALARAVRCPVMTLDRRWAGAGELGVAVVTVG